MKLTRQLIHECATPNGGWNKPQLAAIGIAWPPEKGWLSKIEGREISETELAEFRRLSAFHHKATAKKSGADDSNVESVRAKLSARMKLGLKKYGATTERTDLTRKDWLRHAQEESMDLAVYLERLIQEEP